MLGPDHPDTLTSRNNLAEAYREVGRYAEAIPLYEQALADLERVLGPDHPLTLTLRNNLAEAYQQPTMFLASSQVARASARGQLLNGVAPRPEADDCSPRQAKPRVRRRAQAAPSG